MRRIILLSVIAAMVLFACSNRNRIAITDRNFKDEINTSENLIFTFNHDLATDSMLYVWDTTAYLQFSPAINGKFQWTAKNVLVFSPMTPFPPSTDFTAQTTDKVLRYLERKYLTLDPKSTKIKFHTPYLALDHIETYWKKNGVSVNEAAIGVNVNLTAEVAPKDIANKLKLSIDGKPVTFRVMNATPSNNIQLEVQNVNFEGDEKKIEVSIDKGLTPMQSNWTSTESMKDQKKLSPPTEVDILGIEAQHDGAEGSLFVNMTQQVDEQDLRSYIIVTPKVDYQIDHSTNGFTLRSSEFTPPTIYKITFKKGIRGVFKGRLEQDYHTDAAFGALKPTIEFSEKSALYLSNKGNRNLSVKIAGVEDVNLKITKVFQNNILAFFKNGSQYGYNYEDSDESYNEYQYYDAEGYGTTVFEQDYAVRKLPKSGVGAYILNLNFEDKLPQFNGIYVVEVRDKTRNFITDSKIVAYSDIGLMAKQESNRIIVFANAISTTQPIGGLDVALVSDNNQSVLTATTDGEGIAVFDNLKKRIPDFKVAMLSVKKDNDFNYLLLSQSNVETERYEVGGRLGNEAGYEAFIYGDRDLYRPGETMHISTLLRTTDFRSPANIPIKIKINLPNGKEYQTIRKTLNAQGACETDVSLPDDMVTGIYTIEVYSANDILLNTKSIGVEEFMPDRIKVTVKSDKTDVGIGDSITLNGTAMNLFGPPAVDRNYQVSINFRRDVFAPKGLENYTFQMTNNKEIGEQTTEGKTNTKGEFKETFKIPKEFEDLGLLRGTLFSTVFDESGRPVNRIAKFDAYSQRIFYGIGNFDEYNSTRKAITIPLIAVDKKGTPLNTEVKLNIVRYNWRTVLETTGESGGYRYTSQREIIEEVKDQRIQVNGKNTVYTYIPPQSGEYEVRIGRPDGENYVQRSFYAYRYGDTQTTSFQVNREGNVTIKLDKDHYEVGETATALLTTPFDGKMLVSVERDKVIKNFYVHTSKKAKEVSFAVTADMVPNVFLSATLIRPMNEGNDIPLTVAHGYVPMKVDNSRDSIAVKITAPEKTRSQTKHTIKIQTVANAEVAIALVDEGILQLKNYKTPDPYGFFHQIRALEVSSHDLYARLFPEVVGNGLLSGGGDAYDLGKRVNPMTNKRVKLVSFWSGLKTANSSGIVEWGVNLPKFSGDLRVMAVAYKGSQMGSSEAHIQVADPIVISTGLPRFTSPGDSLLVPVTFSNTTNKAATGNVSFSTTGPLQLIGKGGITVNIPANSESRADFLIAVQPSIGEGSVTASIEALGEKFAETLDISVRPPASLQKESGSGSLKAGESEAFVIGKNYFPSSTDAQLVVSASPLGEFAGDLEALIGYPHGCVEQTISKAFPQIYVQELSKSLQRPLTTAQLANENNPNYNVQEAVRKLESMQLYNGALSYWQGSDAESWWGSILALHFLYEAKKAGFEVKDKSFKDLTDYVIKRSAQKETFKYRYMGNTGKEMQREIAKKEIPYSLFVLALAGKPQLATMNYYKSNPNLLSLDGKYLVAAGYALSGDKTKYNNFVPAKYEGERSVQVFDDSFYSALRDEALSLYALLEADPQNQQIGILTKHLVDNYKKERWHSTQEQVFTLLSIGKIAKMNNQVGTATATVTVGGKTVGTFDGKKDLILRSAVLKGGEVNLTAKENGKLYYYWTAEGIPTDGSYKETDNFLKVRKTFYDRAGRKLDKLIVRQNDLIVVELNLQTIASSDVSNIVVTDMLPAGLEIENPRISELPDMNWIKDAATPEHQDLRDDRVNLYTTATATPKRFYYLARAVSQGTYKMGPATADAMYAGEYHSAHGGGLLKIVKR